MKDVAIARKKRGSHNRVNVGQPVVELDTNDPKEALEHACSKRGSSASASEASGMKANSGSKNPEKATASTLFTGSSEEDQLDWPLVQQWLQRSPQTAPLQSSLSLATAYERARATYHFDLTQLSILTNFNISRPIIPYLCADASRFAGLIEEQQWSYLEYVPAVYDSSKCLAAATDCVLSKASQVLLGCPSSERTLRLYSKAITSLQEAIADPQRSADDDVLCAIQLLSLHELLDPSRSTAFAHHLKGSALLFKHRGPTRFKSEYEKALFAGHIGAMVADAMQENVHCYLAAPEWMELYDSLAKRDLVELDDRHQLVVDVRKHMFHISGLWHDVEAALNGESLYDDEELDALEKRCKCLHKVFVGWMEQYKSHCFKHSLTRPSHKELCYRREAFGCGLDSLLLCKRLRQCVCRDAAQRIALEVEVQAVAEMMLDLQDQPDQPKYSWLFAGREQGVAMNTKAMKALFEEEEREDAAEERLAMRRRYVVWNRSLRLGAAGTS